MSSETPFSDGRDGKGRFRAGNSGGPGNPHSKRSNRIRAEIFRAIDPKAVGRIVKRLLDKAETGDVDRTTLDILNELLNRAIGKPVAGDVEARIAALEQLASQQQESNANQ
jgi:hypothetical protein